MVELEEKLPRVRIETADRSYFGVEVDFGFPPRVIFGGVHHPRNAVEVGAGGIMVFGNSRNSLGKILLAELRAGSNIVKIFEKETEVTELPPGGKLTFLLSGHNSIESPFFQLDVWADKVEYSGEEPDVELRVFFSARNDNKILLRGSVAIDQELWSKYPRLLSGEYGNAA